MIKGKKILIIDDEADIRKVLHARLKSMEFDVMEGSNGSDALRLAQEHIPDLIILDIMMPELDGYETCGILKSHQDLKHIPIILLTAKTKTEDMLQGIESKADAYISKPYDFSKLFEKMKELLHL